MPRGMTLSGKRARKDTVAAHHEVLANIPKGRYALANPEEALRASKSMTTKAIRGHGPVHMGSAAEGDALKKGLQSFADSTNMSQGTKDALASMDSDKLEQLYRENRFVFEVGFNYEGVRQGVGGLEMSEAAHQRKEAEFQHVIDEYTRRFS